MVKGVNRHSFSVDGGRATSAAMSRQDALLVKDCLLYKSPYKMTQPI